MLSQGKEEYWGVRAEKKAGFVCGRSKALKSSESQRLFSTLRNTSLRSKAGKERRGEEDVGKKDLDDASTGSSSQKEVYRKSKAGKPKLAQSAKKVIKIRDKCLNELLSKNKEKKSELEKSKNYCGQRPPVILLRSKKAKPQPVLGGVNEKVKGLFTSVREAALSLRKGQKIFPASRNGTSIFKTQKSAMARSIRPVELATSISSKRLLLAKRDTRNKEDKESEVNTVIEYECENSYSWIYEI